MPHKNSYLRVVGGDKDIPRGRHKGIPRPQHGLLPKPGASSPRAPLQQKLSLRVTQKAGAHSKHLACEMHKTCCGVRLNKRGLVGDLGDALSFLHAWQCLNFRALRGGALIRENGKLSISCFR